jgi:hypothetical protein
VAVVSIHYFPLIIDWCDETVVLRATVPAFHFILLSPPPTASQPPSDRNATAASHCALHSNSTHRALECHLDSAHTDGSESDPAAPVDPSTDLSVDSDPRLFRRSPIVMASESKQQSSHDSGAKGSAAASSSSSGGKPVGKVGHLTPLKTAERSLDADDTLFTESFVRKMTPRSTQACKLLGVLPDELVLR